MSNESNGAACPPALRLEQLEVREVPAILIQLDYSYDTGFFANNPQARATLERAATELGNSVSADLSAVVPSGGNTWVATFPNPATGATQVLSNPSVGANAIRVYVGARALGGGEAGYASTAGYSASGTPGWVRTVETRGWSGFAPWGGSIAFDTSPAWYFGESASGLGSSQLDFYSVALHELGHVLGIGTSRQWQGLSQGGFFRGASATAEHGGPVPLTADGMHWADDGHGHESLESTLPLGQRIGWSALDAAALRDIGWSSGGSGGAAGVPPGTILFALSMPNGVFVQYAFRDGAVTPTGQLFVPFPGFTGGLRQAFGDVNGDGVLDTVVSTTGPGPSVLAVVSGLDGRVIGAPRLVNGSVTALLAADLDGDGHAEVITAGAAGVYVYSSGDGLVRPYARVSAFGEPGRAGLRVSTGDIDRAGHEDNVSVSAAPSEPSCGCGCSRCAGGHVDFMPVAPAPSTYQPRSDAPARSTADRITSVGQLTQPNHRPKPPADLTEVATSRDGAEDLWGAPWVG